MTRALVPVPASRRRRSSVLFRWSGRVRCGLAYCYARPTHEYLGFSAGLDFESKILVKENAPELLRKALSSPKWKPQELAMSSVTNPREPKDMNPPEHRAEDEIDVLLLEDSLRLTPWQRLQENERALALVRMLEAAQASADGTAK